MQKRRPAVQPQEQEPIGIVIAGWPPVEEHPRVHAYVWGPAPEPEYEEATAVRAA